MKEYRTHSVEETERLAAALGSMLQAGDVIAYTGGMGAGKTAFTRGLAMGMGITEGVSSPTFALVNEYRGTGLTLYHFDMYRIHGWEDLYSTGFFDYLDMGGVLAVEWSENAQEALPPNTLWISLEQQGEDQRKITIKGDERIEHLGN